MNKRSFLLGIGSVFAAPAIVRAENIMRIVAPRPSILRYDVLCDAWVGDLNGVFVKVTSLFLEANWITPIDVEEGIFQRKIYNPALVGYYGTDSKLVWEGDR